MMKSEIDALMQARDMDAILVFGNAEHNPPMYYLTGGGHVSHATLIKKRGNDAPSSLVTWSMTKPQKAD